MSAVLPVKQETGRPWAGGAWEKERGIFLFMCQDSIQGALVQHHLERAIRKLHLCHVHPQEAHLGPSAGIAFLHLLDDDLADVDIHYILTAHVIQLLA